MADYHTGAAAQAETPPPEQSPSERPMSKAWHWHPALPIKLSPIMDIPPKPLAWLKWVASYWLAISATTIELVLAWVIFATLQPDASTMRGLAPGWIMGIWARNMLIFILIAGSLHWWFYIIKGQGKKLKFDPRDLARNNGKFSFRDQVKDNMFWSLASGVTIWTGFEVLYFWAASNGYAPGLEWRQNPLLFVALFVLTPLWTSFHFYVIHRFLHIPILYRLVHHLHHRNINVGPWSGLAMHPVEHLLYYSSILIHFIVPSHPVHILFHFYAQSINAVTSHSGFDGLVFADKKRMEAGDFFHQLHHRYINCNYGSIEMPWDRLFGSFDDGKRTNST